MAHASEKISGVYVVRSQRTGKVYVGSSSDVALRWLHHEYDLNHEKHPNAGLQAAWLAEGGASGFTFDLVQSCDARQLERLEQRWLDRLGAAGPRGYNACPRAGSSRSRITSAATRAKLSAARKRSLSRPKAP